MAAKWWVIAALAATSAGGIGYFTLASSAPQAPAPVVRPRPVAGALQEPPVAPPAASLSEPVAALPPEPARAPGPVPSGRASAANGAPDIQAQIALIDRARAAAAAGNPVAALSALDEYAGRFPRGVLGQEAAMLRIEALLARGDKAGAARVGKRFLEQHPRSALAPRVRALTATD